MFEKDETPSSVDGNDEDFDALYDSIVSPNGDGPSQETEITTAPPSVDKEAPPPEPEYEYTWSGQKIKAPLSEILKKAGMGHDYAQQTARLHRERQDWEQERTLSAQLKEQYAPVDEWVRGNPDKWEKLQSVIQAEKAGHGDLDVNHPLFQKYQQLEKQLNERILPKIEEQEQKEIRLKQEVEDKDLETEIQSIRDKYKDLDWAKVSDNGRSEVEMKVLKHASGNGFKTFRAAFLDLYHDDLEKRAEERGKSSIANDRLKQAKTGLLGKTQAPTTGLQRATNTKNKSWADVTREAKEELGIQ
tara:strand:- start:2307 stop:3212 length:906 start_codon:yes stop_codon:yes gene_type:complete